MLCGKAGSSAPARGTCQGRSLKHICCGLMMAWPQTGQPLACHMCQLLRLSYLGMRSPTTHLRNTYLLRFVTPPLHPSLFPCPVIICCSSCHDCASSSKPENRSPHTCSLWPDSAGTLLSILPARFLKSTLGNSAEGFASWVNSCKQMAVGCLHLQA